jgi:CelD/BcsL family acetyltransferase involved in cellulose biosynthesis
MISVTMCFPDRELGPLWDDLLRRASPNVFMSPAALKAVHATGFADLRVLLAFDRSAPERLVGLWALQRRKPMPLWPATLQALPFYYAFLSDPVVDPAFAETVVPAFLAAIAGDPSLPNVVQLTSFGAEQPAFAVLQRALAAGAYPGVVLAQGDRPVVTRAFGVKRAGSTRKKLRQDWNRLAALGAVEVRNDRTPAAVAEAFETFLALERASWKGERGTAILCSARDVAFARRLVADLAEQGGASVALLCVDGRAIAAQVLMYCGRSAYTWKIGFDAEYGRFSPGALLVDKVTEELFAGTELDAIDSCAVESSFMGQLWAGRRPMADLLIDAGPRPSLVFRLELARLRSIQRLRTLRDRLRARRRTQPSAKVAVAGHPEAESAR